MELLARVDVVIPVYRPDESFLNLLWMLKKQSVKPQKIILMVTRSADAKYPDFTGLCPVEIHELSEEEFDHAGTRNAGAAYSDADYILMMTQDAEPKDTHLVEELVRGFSEDPLVAVSYAKQLPKKNCRIIEQLTRAFNYPDESRTKGREDIETLGIKTFFSSDVCALYDGRIFRELGGFQAPAVFNEDMVYAYKAVSAGYRIRYSAEAMVLHSHNLTLKEQFHRNFDIGVSQADHPEIFGLVSSEKEGGKLVKTVTRELFKTGQGYYFPYFICQSAAKYFGFRLGKRYRKFSLRTLRCLSGNPHYWKEKQSGTDQSDTL